jgi:hypothetical protein
MLTCSRCNGKTKEALYSEDVQELGNTAYAGVVMLFKSAIEDDVTYQETRYQLAKTDLACNKYELAEKGFKKTAMQNPARTDIPLEPARIHLITNKPDLAVHPGHQAASRGSHPGKNGHQEPQHKIKRVTEAVHEIENKADRGCRKQYQPG